MKAWISKYALTKGIYTNIVTEFKYTVGMVIFGENDSSFLGDGCHKTKEEAVAKAEEMRLKRIASLKKQIEKLESMKFD